MKLLMKFFLSLVMTRVVFVVSQGMTIKPLVSLLNIGLSKEKVLSLYQEINDHVNLLGNCVFLKGNCSEKIFIAEYLWISCLYYKYICQTFH